MATELTSLLRVNEAIFPVVQLIISLEALHLTRRSHFER